jgi:hypothetical protein
MGTSPQDNNMGKSIHELLAATLTELGQPAPSDILQTMLTKDGYFVGWKFRYDGGYAISLAGDNRMEFYDEDGNLLRTVTVEADKGEAA